MSLTIKGPGFPALQTLRFMKDMPGFFRECVQKYGDPFLIQLPFGKIAVTGDPEGLKEIFTADPDIFVPVNTKMLEPLMGLNSVFLISGARHKRERKLLMPMFHGERMRAYGEVMQQCTQLAMEKVRPGEEIVSLELAMAITLEVIVRAVMGAENPERRQMFREVLKGLMDSATPTVMMVMPLRRNFGGFGPYARFMKRKKAADELLDDELTRRRAATGEKADMMTMLLAARDEEGQPMTDREIKDELITMLVAGHDTTAVGITWALFWIHRHPEVKQKLDEELRSLGPNPTPEALTKLPYLSAVCDEVLRVRPVAGLVPRRVTVPFTLKGHVLPPGMGIYGSIILAHGNPAVYPEPDTFRPERFLERKFTPFEYIPFGGGARRCIGAAFSSFQMKVTLGTLLMNHRFSRTHDRMARTVRRNVTLPPDDGVPLRYEGPVQGSASAPSVSAA